MKLKKNLSTSESRAFWAHVERIAEKVYHLPKELKYSMVFSK